MGTSILRVLVCDPETSSRERLCACLGENSLITELTPMSSTGELTTLLAAKKINLLFIDPMALELEATSKSIFQVRGKFPHVVICLYLRFSELRRRTEAFYAGERERFEHYFRLNKEVAGPGFEGETALLLSHCFAAARSLSRHPRRVQLISSMRFSYGEARTHRSFSVESQRARETSSPAGMTEILPPGNFLASLPGLRYFPRRLSPS